MKLQGVTISQTIIINQTLLHRHSVCLCFVFLGGGGRNGYVSSLNDDARINVML